MSYTVSHFETLRQRFPTWAELKAHIESPEGGALRVVEQEGNPLVILRYVKGTSVLGSAELGTGLFRSVVWDTAANLPVCVAPPKARDGLPPTGVQLSATEDFVDGVMMSAFLPRGGSLGVATRTILGGTTTFYSSKSFVQLFDEALAATPLKTRAGLEAALKTYLETGAENTAAFVSFVLQHPEHRVVAKVPAANLFVVHMGTVNGSGAVQVSERAVNWPQQLARMQIPSYPIRIFRSEQEIQDLLRKTGVQRGWRWQGLVFKDGAGARWRLRTPTYQMLRELRGAEATQVDRFLRLRRERKVKEYLTHYGEERKEMWQLEETMRARTADVLAAYADVHKAHAVKFAELPEALKPAVFLLHVKWRDELREKGFKVRLQNAIEVVNKLRAFEQRRLMEAEAYTAISPSTRHEEAGEEADTAEEQVAQ
jgi:hypothetical protein